MFRPLRSLRAVISTNTHSITGTRTFFAIKTRPEKPERSAPQRIPHSRVDFLDEPQSPEDSDSLNTIPEEESWNGSKLSWKEPDPRFAEHLNALFPTLSFPVELARRVLTHNSHPASAYGHNAAFSFIGRRVLESYLLLMLSSSQALKPTHDMDVIVQRALNSYVVGQHVGSKWGLGRKLRWTPTLSKDKLKPSRDQKELLRSVGLYKVQGDAVSAITGGIYHQFGASVAHRVFHTRILPNLIHLPEDGLPEAFAEEVDAICQRMGGPEGSLLTLTSTSRQSSSGSH